MKSYDSGKKKRISKKDKGGVDHVKGIVASLSNEKIHRMLNGSGLNKADKTGRSIFNNIQPKLEISQPQDAAEIQADKVADGVTKGDTALSKSALTQNPVSEINAKSEGGAMQTSDAFDSSLQNTKGQGQKLDNSTKSELEQHTGTDLSGVNVHTNSKAAELSENINAKAFTHGQDIYFNSGQYNPASNEGKSLLAHEVAHTVQQGNGLSRKIQRSMKFEIETDNFIWQVNQAGTPSYVPRKFGQYGGDTESGDKPGYISTGEHGLGIGEKYFKELKGSTVMKETKIKPEDSGKTAQIIKEYRFIKPLKFTKIIGDLQMPLELAGKQANSNLIKLIRQTNNANVPGREGKYIPNTFKYIYYDAKGTKPLEICVDNKGFFQLHKQGIVEVNRKDVPDGLKKFPQFVIVYKFKNKVKTEADVLGKPMPNSDLIQIRFEDLSKKKATQKDYNPNLYHIEYVNESGQLMNVHRDEDGIMRKSVPKFMEVKIHGALSDKKVIEMANSNKTAQYIEIWKITKNPKGEYSYFGEKVNVEMVKPQVQKSNYVPGTFDRRYYLAEDFVSGSKLKDGAHRLDVYRDEKGNFAKGKKIFKGDQTAMELQSEAHGKIEFETPNWLRDWKELKVRVEDAVKMTELLSKGTLVTDKTHPGLRDKMQAIKNKNDGLKKGESKTLGEIREWPASVDIKHLKQSLNGQKLFVEIAKPAWDAFFQVSESISISQYGSLAEDYAFTDEKKISALSRTYSSSIFDKAKSLSAFKTSDNSLFEDLKGFLQLVIAYIIYGQYYPYGGSKKTFSIMARNNFGQMYLQLLSADERKLFANMVQTQPNPFYSKELEREINKLRAERDPGDYDWMKKGIKLNAGTLFFASEAKTNPTISEWLASILKGKDKLDGKTANVSDAMAGKDLELSPGNKDYKKAMFEKRSGTNVTAAGWVAKAEEYFKMAERRSIDIPDDPTTSVVNESSKTSMKK